MKIQELIFRVIRVYTPKLEQIIDIFLKRKNIFKPVKLKFSEIFFQNAWDCEESLSGSGSSLVQTVSIRKELPILLKKINAMSLLDIPCGDFNWLNKTNLTIDKYIGDAMMVFFGDPEFVDDETHARQCVLMAVEMLDKIRILSDEWLARGSPSQLAVRMGINTGFCTVG
ncbi:hypothetical protein LCGC14_2127340, partial [marine sediment metagenome]